MELIPIGARVAFTYLLSTPMIGKVVSCKYNVVEDDKTQIIYPIAYLITIDEDRRWIDADRVVEI